MKHHSSMLHTTDFLDLNASLSSNHSGGDLTNALLMVCLHSYC